MIVYCMCMIKQLVRLYIAKSNSNKTPVVFTLENKLAIVDRLTAGTTQNKLAEEHGIRHSMVGNLKL